MYASIRSCLSATAPIVNGLQVRWYQVWPKSINPDSIYMPSRMEDRLLPALPYTPVEAPDGVIMPLKHPRHDIDMRGPERIHNQLIYRQYGIIALGGGALLSEHYELIRIRVNKYMDTERFFAVWRVDAPWKAVSRKSLGKKKGGGKGKVRHYEFPVRAGRIIFEIGGVGEYGEVKRILDYCSQMMPFYSIPVTQEELDRIDAEYQEIEDTNYNPFSYRQLIRNNYSDSQRLLSPYEEIWGGRYF